MALKSKVNTRFQQGVIMKKVILSLILLMTVVHSSICDSVKAEPATSTPPASTKKENTGRNKKDRYIIDSIIAVVPSPEGNKVITQSELDRPAIDGTMRSKQDLVRNARLHNKAREYGMLPSETDIDEHLNSIKRENKMTHDDIVKLFDSAGYTFAEGREQLGEMSAISTFMSVKVHSRLLVPEREIRAYYDEHPEYLEPQFELQRGLMPFDMNMTKDEQREKIEATLRAGRSVPNIIWADAFWIDLVDLAEDKQFITQMQPGEVRLSQELVEGFEFFKLLDRRDRRLKSYEDRYNEIATLLRRPRAERMFSELEQQLEATMPVIYMDPVSL
jgi:hypothetical protein